jgi:2-polyprenyl-3-methyl-5-hydroxy-6-metoxy-1,4-benzoquinol methylase
MSLASIVSGQRHSFYELSDPHRQNYEAIACWYCAPFYALVYLMISIKDFSARDKKLIQLCATKRVLHLGCVGFTDHSIEDKLRLARSSLHFQISEVSDCVGLDNDRESIDQLQAHDIFSNVMYGDAEQLGVLQLEPFDIILASDIIEHLSNPGRMLDGARHLLKSDGRLIVSTPNAFSALAFLRYGIGKFREGAQHVLNYNHQTLEQLLNRHGYQVEHIMTCYQRISSQRAGRLTILGEYVFKTFPRFGGTLLAVASIKS